MMVASRESLGKVGLLGRPGPRLAPTAACLAPQHRPVLALKSEGLGIGRVGVAPTDVVADGLGQLEMA